jgi:tripartite-type tricarboxylate transporter receptor subunit TctC
MNLARFGFCALMLIAALAVPASAQERAYPARPVKVMVPFPPGGSIDVIARAYAVELEKALGQPFVVENKPGASGSIATAALAKSAPDGYTLGLTLDGIIINYLLASPRYKIPDDFQPVATLANIPLMLVVNPKVPANTFEEYVALAKAKPRALNYASSGNASISHLLMELVNLQMGIETTHVPFTGGPPGMNATLAGDIDGMLVSVVMGMPNVKAGKLRVLAVGSPNRLASLPDVPTIAEAGNPKLQSLATWAGVQAPAGTPKAIVEKLNAEINRIAKTPEMIDKLEKLGAQPFTGSVEDFARFEREELQRWGELFKTIKVKVE